MHTCERLLFSEIKWDALRCVRVIVMIGLRSRSGAGTLREAYPTVGGEATFSQSIHLFPPSEFRISLLSGCHRNFSSYHHTLPVCDLLSYLVGSDRAESS